MDSIEDGEDTSRRSCRATHIEKYFCLFVAGGEMLAMGDGVTTYRNTPVVLISRSSKVENILTI